jgi:glycosyltransferase involved in cell wall biosynthesis
MPEVAGAGALLVEPTDVAQISAAMTRVYLDLDLRQQLRQQGHDNSRRFSWDKSAEKVMQVLETCATAKALQP